MENKRKFIHLYGQQSWCIETVKKLVCDDNKLIAKVICCGINNKFFVDNNATYINNQKKRSEIENHLGTEYSVLIYNCFDGFNPDLFCALAGLIKAPGIIILITPDIPKWPSYDDPEYSKICSYPYTSQAIKGRYINYIIHKLNEYSNSCQFLTLHQNSSLDIKLNSIKTGIYNNFLEIASSKCKQVFPTIEQTTIITAIEKLAKTSISKEIILIYGNRGRGKSTVIGLALQLLAQTLKISRLKISIVSQNKRNVIPVFEQITEIERSSQTNFSLDFVPPDEFLRNKPDCDLLIIDEAAAISLAVLKQLVESTSKLIISSTIDGYEGTGMGLWTKLQTYLSDLYRPVEIFELTIPQRWAKNDPVENFIFETFLSQKNLSSDNDNVLGFEQKIHQINIEKIDRDALSQDTAKVHQLFQFLAQAHYRTTPDDLRYMLDAPGVELWIANYGHDICAVLMVCNEAIIDSALEQDIWLGKRRVNGHLIPQTLSSQCGFKQAIRFSYKRIARIAVKEKYRRKGIAKKLLDEFHKSIVTQNQDTDFIGVSYGFELYLYEFWRNLNFRPIRISHRENARSGLKSMIMLKPISAKANNFCSQLENKFKQDLKFNITHLKDEIINSEIVNFDTLDNLSKNHHQDQLDIYTFAFGNRQYSNCRRSLYEFGMSCLNTRSLRKKINQKQVDLITFKVLQNKDWTKLANLSNLKGKKQLMVELRATYSILYNAVWGNKS